MKMSRREFLGIYIYAKPKNEQQRMFNQDMLNKAEAIRCIRVQSLINEEFGFLDKNKQKVDFLAYFRTKASSDAAHELRSPLTALKVQTEVAQLSDDDPQARKKALLQLHSGI